MNNSISKLLPVTVIMPIRNESHYIIRNLGSELEQDYPSQCLEIFIADGISIDYTPPLIKSHQRKQPHLRLIYNPGHIALQLGYLDAAIEYYLLSQWSVALVRVDQLEMELKPAP